MDGDLQKKLWALFARPYRPTLKRESTALVCVDLQYANTHPDFGFGARARRLGIANFLDEYYARINSVVLPNVARLQKAARRTGLEVIHLRVATLTRDGRDNSRRYRRRATHLVADAEEAAIVPEVAPQGDEIVLSKVTSSAFNSTNIDRVLRNIGIETLIVVGSATNACVESTVRSAAELDYDVFVIEDAMAALAPQLHTHAILNMGYRDAVVTSTEDILEEFSRMAEAPGHHLTSDR